MVSTYIECLNKLIEVSNKIGYLTFDILLDTTDDFGLNLSQVDKLTEEIGARGILVYEESPNYEQEETYDYSQTDYEAIYDEIVSVSEELTYLVDIVRTLPTPQRKEIALLTVQCAEGNSFAKERLILLHIRVVLKIALSMSKHYELDLVETVSCGLTGLIIATDKYDPNGFSAFQSYAALWIQQNIQRDCSPVWFEYYHPVHIKEKLLLIYNAFESKVGNICGSYSSDVLTDFAESIENDVELDAHRIMELIDLIKVQKCCKLSYESLIDENGEEQEKVIDDFFSHRESPLDLMMEQIDRSGLKDRLEESLETLTAREKEVLSLRFGLIDGIERTLEEVGSVFGVTRERIRQIEAKALRKLRHPSRNRKLKDYIENRCYN